jgi:hypothetical protein
MPVPVRHPLLIDLPDVLVQSVIFSSSLSKQTIVPFEKIPEADCVTKGMKQKKRLTVSRFHTDNQFTLIINQSFI